MSEKISVTGTSMGTSYTIKTLGNGIQKAIIDKRLNEINKIFSTWDATSEVSLLNQKPINQWFVVSDELFFVLTQSKKLYQQTNGYFDPGIGRLIDLWGFGAVQVNQKPNRTQVSDELQQASIKYLQLKNGSVKKTKNIHIDLSAIAKGYAVDEMVKLLNSNNIQHFLIEIGGEVRAHGKNGNNHWTVGIERPNGTQPIAMRLINQAIATSGDYRHYFIWEGKRYMHILDPNSGLPAQQDLASVSVLHQQTMLADAYATAMMAMGSRNASALAKRLNLSVILILNQQGRFKVIKIN